MSNVSYYWLSLQYKKLCHADNFLRICRKFDLISGKTDSSAYTLAYQIAMRENDTIHEKDT